MQDSSTEQERNDPVSISDVELWQRLWDANQRIRSESGRTGGADWPWQHCRAALRSLAAKPLRTRAAYLGLVLPILPDADPALKRELLPILVDAGGYPARNAIVKQLDDGDSEVRKLAVAAIARMDSTSEWTLALFHARPDVRREAFGFLFGDREGEVFRYEYTTARSLLLPFALTDSATATSAERLFDRVQTFALDIENILHGYADNALDAKQTRRLLRLAGPDCNVNQLADWVHRSGDDAMKRWFELWLSDPDPDAWMASVLLHPRNFSRLNDCGDAIAAHLLPFLLRADIPIANASATAKWVTLAVLLRPQTIAEFSRVLPADIFREALLGFPKHADGCDAPPDLLDSLLGQDWLRRRDGHLDLALVGSLLYLDRQQAFRRLGEAYRPSQIAAGFDADPRSARFLFGHPSKEKAKQDLITWILSTRMHHPDAPAVMLYTLPSEQLTFLARLSATRVFAMLGVLLGYAADPNWQISSNRISRVIHVLLGGALGDLPFANSAWQNWIDRWFSGHESNGGTVSDSALGQSLAQFEIGVELLVQLGRCRGSETFAHWVASWPTECIRKFLCLRPYCSGLGHAVDCLLAIKLIDHSDPDLAGWAEARVPAAATPDTGAAGMNSTGVDATRGRTGPSSATKPGTEIHVVTPEQVRRLCTAPKARAIKQLEAWTRTATSGVTVAISNMGKAADDDLAAWQLTALLASHDDIVSIDRILATMMPDESHWEFACGTIATAKDPRGMSVTARVIAHRFEAALFSLEQDTLGDENAVLNWLRLIAGLKCEVLAIHSLHAASLLLRLKLARERKTASRWITPAVLAGFFEFLPLGGLRTDAVIALLMRCFKARLCPDFFDDHHDAVRQIVPELAPDQRFRLREWCDDRRLGNVTVQRKRDFTATPSERYEDLQRSTDLDWIVSMLFDETPQAASDAAMRLLDLGPLAIDKLAQAVLRCMDPRQCDGGEVQPERVEALCDTVVLWPETQTLQLARSLVQTPGLAACGIFFGLVPTLETIRLRGSRTLLESALQAIRDAVLQPCKRSWVRKVELDAIA
ncbi:MAG: hypothetical protein AAF958_18300, partial [Planctomycetota bacterium]